MAPERLADARGQVTQSQVHHGRISGEEAHLPQQCVVGSTQYGFFRTLNSLGSRLALYFEECAAEAVARLLLIFFCSLFNGHP